MLAVFLARERRRETLRAVGISFVVVGAAIMLGHRIGGNAVVAPFRGRQRGRRRAGDLGHRHRPADRYRPRADPLRHPHRDRRLARRPHVDCDLRPRAITPWLRQPAYAYGGAVALLLLLFWWDPTPATHRLVPSLLLIVLVLLGTEVLRRQVIREFPDRVTTGSAAGVAQGWLRNGCARRVSGGSRAQSPRPRRAGRRRAHRRARAAREAARLGVLTDEEFAAEKRAPSVLSRAQPAAAAVFAVAAERTIARASRKVTRRPLSVSISFRRTQCTLSRAVSTGTSSKTGFSS